jgi:stringent starvation protein B
MIPSRPYFIRALYEWMCDNGWTQHLVMNADATGAKVPGGYAEDGKLVLNIGPSAVQGLNLGNDAIDFSARFGGAARSVHVPIGAVLAIYARETGRGMLFGPEDASGEEPTPEKPDEDKPSGGPHLRVIK